MKTSKKLFLTITFLAVFGFGLGANTLPVKAAESQTVEELEALIVQLKSQIAQVQQKIADREKTTPQWCHDFNTNLRQESRGNEVQALQTVLEKEGFTISSNEKEQNYFGSFTKSAVIGFQEKYKKEILSPWRLARGTGYVGRTTIAQLNKLYGCKRVPSPFKPSPPTPVSGDVQTLTSQLIAKNKELSDRGKQALKTTLLSEMENIAHTRKDRMLAMLKKNPKRFLGLTLSNEEREEMPEKIKAYIERDVVKRGDLEVIVIDDFENQTSKLHYYIYERETKTRFRLFSAQKLPQLVSGTQVKISGVQLDNNVALADAEEGFVAQSTPSLVEQSLGEQKTVVLLVKFEENLNEPFEVSWARDRIFLDDGNTSSGNISTNEYIKEVSYNGAWLTGDVFGWYTVPSPSEEELLEEFFCSRGDVIEETVIAAADPDVDFSNYSRLVIFYEQDPCGRTESIGTIGKVNIDTRDGAVRLSRTWMFEAERLGYNRTAVEHEFGHNFGLYHANYLDCGIQARREVCTIKEYGNYFDVMGTSRQIRGHFNAFYKWRLGWIDDSDILIVARASDTYSIGPLESKEESLPKAIALIPALSLDEVTPTYFIEYRRGIGTDREFVNRISLDVFDGAMINFIEGDYRIAIESSLLDFSPHADFEEDYETDKKDVILRVGEYFVDPIYTIKIRVLQIDERSLTIEVSPVIFRRADFDGDGDVDLADFLDMQACFTDIPGTPGFRPLSSGCENKDLDDDGDVDLRDIQIFQAQIDPRLDFDRNERVDLHDFLHIQTCVTGSKDGPNFRSIGPGCHDADLDRDGDVDQDDINIFTGIFVLSAPFGGNEFSPADFNQDVDVDLEDFAIFESCFTGSEGEYSEHLVNYGETIEIGGRSVTLTEVRDDGIIWVTVRNRFGAIFDNVYPSSTKNILGLNITNRETFHVGERPDRWARIGVRLPIVLEGICVETDLDKDGNVDLNDYLIFKSEITDDSLSLPDLECVRDVDCESQAPKTMCEIDPEVSKIGGVCRVSPPEPVALMGIAHSPTSKTVINRVAGVTQLQVTFNQTVTASEGDIRVVGVNSGDVTSRGTLSGSGTDALVVTFPEKLQDQDRYTVTITTQVRSSSTGVSLSVPESWEFATLVGDCDRNGQVDIFDLGRIRAALKAGTYDEGCDIQEDGVINIFDLVHVRSALQAGAAAPPFSSESVGSIRRTYQYITDSLASLSQATSGLADLIKNYIAGR